MKVLRLGQVFFLFMLCVNFNQTGQAQENWFWNSEVAPGGYTYINWKNIGLSDNDANSVSRIFFSRGVWSTPQRTISFNPSGTSGIFHLSHGLKIQTGKLAVGVTDPTRKLDVDGALRVRSGGISNDPLIDLDHTETGNSRWSRINSEGKLALAANDKLTGSDSTPHLLIDNDGSTFVTGGVNLPSVSKQNRSKYSLFVQKGLLSENYGLGPQSTWADYVFSKNYKLMSLKQLSIYIQKHKHLPNIPSEIEVNKDGYSLHEINVKLVEKIEELTLYTIKQQEELDEVKKDYKTLLKLVKSLIVGKDNLKKHNK